MHGFPIAKVIASWYEGVLTRRTRSEFLDYWERTGKGVAGRKEKQAEVVVSL
jgi:hypothetical protein